MDQTLDKKFSFFSLLSFAVPNVIMMISLSMYVIVDGMFISRFLGTTELSAVNMVYPAICFEMAVSIMIATGGSAIVARKLGEGREKEAQKNLSFLIVVELVLGILLAVLGILFVEQIVSALGASSVQMPMAISYMKILFAFSPAFFLQTAFQTFFVTAGKPGLGMTVTILAGVVNIVLDYIFMGPMQMGLAGAAIATGLGYCVPAVAGIIFFLRAVKHPLHFVRPAFDGKVLLQSCANGSSEMVTNLANAATTYLFNFTLMKFYGEDGVAAITILLYFQFIFTALYFGYSGGIAPVISYKYGKGDKEQLQMVFKNSMVILTVCAVVSNILMRLTISSALKIFTPVGTHVYEIALHGFAIYSLSFIPMGFGIFASSMFTAFSDGVSSAVISFSRTFIFIMGCILILPNICGEAGVWAAVPIAELLGVLVSVFFFIKKRSFGYIKVKDNQQK